MSLLITGLVVFLGLHLVPTMRGLRGSLMEKWGEGPYKLAFTLIAFIGLGLIIYGYSIAPYTPVWYPPPGFRHITFTLMLPVFPLLIAANLPGQIKRWIPHPMLMATKLWAVAHLLTKGTLAGMILFGSFLAWAVYDLVSLKRRERAGLIKIARGPWWRDGVAVVAGLALYWFMLRWGHWKILGVPVLLP